MVSLRTLRRRSSVGVGGLLKMIENFSDDARLGDESHHAEGPSAGTEKGVELENSSNQIRPASAQCLLSGGADGGLVFLLVVARRTAVYGRLGNFSSSSTNDVGVVAVIEQQMSSWLRDLDDDSCQELESVDGFEPWEELLGVVVRGPGLVEDVGGTWAPLGSGKTHGRAQHVTSDVLESLAFACRDANGIVCAESAPRPRKEQLDTLVTQKLLSFEQAEHAMTEELLYQSMVEIGHGHPLGGGVPTAPGTKGMDMWMKSGGLSESLDDGDHARTKAVMFESCGAHELLDGLVGASGELAEKLAVVEEVAPEHLGDRENPHRVRDVLEDFVVKEGGKCGGALGIA